MEITLCQSFLSKDDSLLISLYKTIESKFLPHRGDFVSDSAFQAPDEHEIKRTVINYESELCSVYLKPILLEDDKDLEAYLKRFKRNGWIDQLFRNHL